MTWENILKRINPMAARAIDEIMLDGKRRTDREIIEEMWDKIELYNKERAPGIPILTGKSIPTPTEISHYLFNNPEYDNAATGKWPKATQREYWRVD